nr:unnamed protein product [Digitaria exilis]
MVAVRGLQIPYVCADRGGCALPCSLRRAVPARIERAEQAPPMASLTEVEDQRIPAAGAGQASELLGDDFLPPCFEPAEGATSAASATSVPRSGGAEDRKAGRRGEVAGVGRRWSIRKRRRWCAVELLLYSPPPFLLLCWPDLDLAKDLISICASIRRHFCMVTLFFPGLRFCELQA